MKTKYVLNTALVCGLLALTSAVQAQFSITTFDCPAGSFTEPSSINAAGQVTGQCNDAAGWHAFVKNGATVTPFDAGTPNFATNGTSINASGTVAGNYVDGVGGDKGFVYTNGTSTLFTILDTTTGNPAFLVYPRSINASGKVVGEYLDTIPPSSGIYRGFIYDSTTNTYTIIDAMGVAPGNWTIPVSINDSDQVAGTAANTHGFVYSAGAFTLFDAPGGSQTVPRSINNSGQVVGTYYDLTNVQHGFLYSGGLVTTVDIAGATATDAWSINDSGQMAGYYTDTLGFAHGFVKTGTTIITIDVAGATDTVPRSINTSGQVTGWYIDVFGLTHGFVTTAIGSTATPPPTVSCVKPKGAKSSAGKGRVTAVGTNFVMVGSMRIDYAACTSMNYGGDAKAPAVHDRVEWEGYAETSASVMAKTLSFN